MTSQRELAQTDLSKRGISLLTDNTAHWSYRRKAPEPERITMDVRDSELSPGSDATTLPNGTEVRREATVQLSDEELEIVSGAAALPGEVRREPTVALDSAEIEVMSEGDETTEEAGAPDDAGRNPLLPSGSESSAMFSLQTLIAISRGEGAPKPADAPAADAAPQASPAGPERQSSVMMSLASLRLLEEQRVADEKAGECQSLLDGMKERLGAFKAEYEKTKGAYSDWGIAMDNTLDEAAGSQESKYDELSEKLEAAKAEIRLSPDEAGYKDAKTLHGELDALASEIKSAAWNIGALEMQNKMLLVTFEKKRREAEQVDLQDTEGEGVRISRLTKYFREEGDSSMIGGSYRLELSHISKNCTFCLQSKADGYEKIVTLPEGKETSETLPDGTKVVLELSGPDGAGVISVRIGIVTKKKAPSEESLDRGVDELISGMPERLPSLEIDMSLEEPKPAAPSAPPARPRGKLVGTILGIGRVLGIVSPEPAEEKTLTPPAGGPTAPKAAQAEPEGATNELSLTDIETEEPDNAQTGELGIPWNDQHSQFTLSEHELTMCEDILEERKLYWIVPVPEASDEKAAARFAKDTVVRLRGRAYHVIEGDGFAGARRIARLGNLVHSWPEAMTNYEFLESISTSLSAEYKVASVEWPAALSGGSYVMSLEECAKCNYFFPDNRPRWLHPVPDADTRNAEDSQILESMRGTQQITLAGKKFYVINVNTATEWREMVLFLPKTRIVSRGGNWLTINKREENGYYMFFNSNSSQTSYFGAPMASLKDKKGIVPYDSERDEIEQLFGAMKDVWLYELDNLRDMPAGSLSWIIKSGNTLIEQKGVSPVVSVGGRWYAALDIFIPDSVKAVYNGQSVVAVTGSDHKDRLTEMRKKLAGKRVGGTSSIPAGPVLSDEVVRAIPEGEVRFLYYVGPENQGVSLQRATVTMTMDDEKHTYIIIDRHMEGVIPVQRRGNKLYMAKGSFGDGPAMDGEDSVELDIDI
ncbi:MAG TPA: hypothetical protein VLD37_02845 [Candidatus Bilamarchaeum sp.]|nr:hypothetical protein [Candidatus Bilamarchaeum sp.]